MAYQKKASKYCCKLFSRKGETDVWFKFLDENGPGHASPDLFFVLPDRVVVLEFKLSQCPEGLAQLEFLYFPLLGQHYKRPVVGAMVYKWIREKKDTLQDPLALLTSAPAKFTAPAEWHLVL